MAQKKWTDQTNMSLLVDFYELTMGQGYFDGHFIDSIAYFDLFFRAVPEGGGYAICAGLEQVIDYLKNISFSSDDIKYLKSKNIFSEAFLDYLKQFKFACDIWAVPEGSVVFPGEPLLKVRGPIIQAQMIETMLLATLNHQSLIATKASRIVRAAQGRSVFEFGARRAQSYDAAVLGARAAYIAGVSATSCTIAGLQFDIPVFGTMAHSWVQLFDTEYEAFSSYAHSFPDQTVLLVDTYNVLKQGIPNSIAVNNNILKPMGKSVKGIRIDSGDLTYLTQRARAMLDEAGMKSCQITVSNALDEYLIRELIMQGACVDAFGVGERLITSRAEPVFGGVYKLSAIEKDDKIEPRMKVSENLGKVTNPCNKDIIRFYDRISGKALADILMTTDEAVPDGKPYEIFDPIETWKRKELKNYTVRRMLEPIFVNGKCIYDCPSIEQIRSYCKTEMDSLWESVKRFENPQNYYVDLSPKLWDIRYTLLHRHMKNIRNGKEEDGACDYGPAPKEK